MAIAYEAKMEANGSGSASGTLTTVGTNQIIFAACNADADPGVPTVDAVNMTLVAKANNGTQYWAMYYMVGTSAGGRTVAFSGTGTCWLQTAQYSGAKQTGQPDGTPVSNNGNTPKTTTVTTVADNCWAIIMGSNYAVATTITSGATQVSQTAGILADSRADITPAGAYDIVLSDGSPPHTEYVIMASFAPFVEGGAANHWLLTGV